MRAALGQGSWPCQPDEPQWLAPAWQWERLLAILESWEGDHPGGGPHPGTGSWQARLGRRIPGATFGHRTPSVIEQAVGARATDPDWDARLASSLADFTLDGPQWPASLLRRLPAEAAPG
jgi:hypothetical protein